MQRVRRRLILTTLVLLPVLAVLGAWTAPPTKWRMKVVTLKLGGALDALSWPQLLRMLAPSSPYKLASVLEDGDVYNAIRNPYKSQAQLEQGAALFAARCSVCHGAKGTGDTGPSLSTGEFKYGASDWALFNTIAHGVPGTPMPAHDLSERELWSAVAFVRSLANPEVSGGDSARIAAPEVSHDDIRDGLTNGDWLTYSGSYDGTRFSTLKQIDRTNVKRLKMLWAFQLNTRFQALEASPLVAKQTMYLTAPGGGVWALDARTGEALWSIERPLPANPLACCGLVNRGLAIAGNTLYLGTIDARLVAIQARTGKVEWDVPVADHAAGYSMTGAPLVVRDKVIIGVGGGEYGIRGFIAAYDAVTGKKAWQFSTIPGPGEPGNDSWAGDSWKTGGAPTWLTGSYDPDLNLVYWGVGNPGPDYNGDTRQGDNLYSNSVVALDAATGKLRWHFQFTPHDERDWDSNQIPVLFDVIEKGQPRKLMGWANRNGFYYLLDRETGRFLRAEAYVRQNWAKGIDANGRPIQAGGSASSAAGVLTYPAKPGATNWWSPSYSSKTGLFYVPTIESGGIFNRTPATYQRGAPFLGGTVEGLNQRRFLIRALNAQTGKLVWEFQRSAQTSPESRRAGILSTAGGLVVTGDESVLVALDDQTGRELWAMNLGGPIVAAPITYLIDGKQRISIAAGRSVFTFGLD